jgi:hypothetical protein
VARNTGLVAGEVILAVTVPVTNFLSSAAVLSVAAGRCVVAEIGPASIQPLCALVGGITEAGLRLIFSHCVITAIAATPAIVTCRAALIIVALAPFWGAIMLACAMFAL